MFVTVTIHRPSVIVLYCYFHLLAGLYPNTTDKPATGISDSLQCRCSQSQADDYVASEFESSATKLFISAMARREDIDLLERPFKHLVACAQTPLFYEGYLSATD